MALGTSIELFRGVGPLSFILISFLFLSCAGRPGSSDETIAESTEVHASPDWESLKLIWNVELQGGGVCPSARGIEVRSDGVYFIRQCGDPNNQVGELSQDDHRQLLRFSREALEPAGAAWACIRTEDLEESALLRVWSSDSAVRTIYEGSGSGERQCFRGGLDEIRVLVEYLETLADWYVLRPDSNGSGG